MGQLTLTGESMRKAFSSLRSDFACIALVFLAVQTIHAQTTINVPADQPTIQAAIAAAQPGDTVLIAPGTYLENLDFLGKAITVTSSAGAATTIVDGNAAGPVVTFKSGEGTGSILSNLTLRNGIQSNTFPLFNLGGGIAINLASPTITGNVITGNRAVCGIGIEIRGGSPVIGNNIITGNTQAFGGDGGCGGGALKSLGRSSPTQQQHRSSRGKHHHQQQKPSGGRLRGRYRSKLQRLAHHSKQLHFRQCRLQLGRRNSYPE